MAWGHVQTTSLNQTTTANTIPLAYGSNVTPGSLLACAVGWAFTAGQTVSVSDSLGQTWTQIGTVLSFTGTGTWALTLFYFPNTAGGANTVTATVSASINRRIIGISEYSGIATTSPVDQQTSQALNSNTTTDGMTSGNVTTTANGELIYGAGLTNDTSSLVLNAGTGFTSRTTSTDGTFIRLRIEDLLQASAGVTAATFTDTATGNKAGMFVATFKLPGVAAGGLFRQSKLNGLDVGGPFFSNPIGRHRQPSQREWALRDRIFVPRHVYDEQLLERAA